MEKAKNDSDVFCPLHPSYSIQAINMGKSEGQQLFCTQCMLQQKDFSILSNLKAILDLIDAASSLYSLHKESIRFGDKPQEYLDILSGQAEMIEKVNQHIEEEKKKVSAFFDSMAQMIIGFIAEKKEEYSRELDQQMAQVLKRFSDFDKQLKKAYPTEEDIASLYPTQEALETRFKSIKSFDQLAGFTRDLKEDLLNEEMSGVVRSEGANQAIVRDLYEDLQKLRDIKPQYAQNDQIFVKFENRFKKELHEFCKEEIVLMNKIPEVSIFKLQESGIVTKKEFQAIKGWLPPNLPFNPRLVYKSSRDGAGAAAFHKQCDGVKNTVTLIKAIYEGCNEPCVVGGYLDAAWHSGNSFIPSTEAFVFSVTANLKCPVVVTQQAAYGGKTYGPTFGSTCDLEVFLNGNDKGHTQPSCYNGSRKLVHSMQLSGAPRVYFKAVEVEVYTLV